jgi:hypothetical protein
MVEGLARVSDELDRRLSDGEGESIRSAHAHVDPKFPAVEIGQVVKTTGWSRKPDLGKSHCASVEGNVCASPLQGTTVLPRESSLASRPAK